MVFKGLKTVWPSHRGLVNTCYSSETSWGEERKVDSFGSYEVKTFITISISKTSFKKNQRAMHEIKLCKEKFSICNL